MELGQSVSICMSKYAKFSGRASRSEFWLFFLFINLMFWVVQIVGTAISFFVNPIVGSWPLGLLTLVMALALTLPWFAAGSRRLHDIGKSGWWQLIVFLPIIGSILLILWWAKDTKPEGNRFNEA